MPVPLTSQEQGPHMRRSIDATEYAVPRLPIRHRIHAKEYYVGPYRVGLMRLRSSLQRERFL